MAVPRRHPQSQTDATFERWIRLLKETDMIHDELKTKFVEDLTASRHVMIVDARRYFSDALQSGRFNMDGCPFAILSRVQPFVVLDSYDGLDSATDFCKSAGLSFEIHDYHDRYFSKLTH